MRLEEARKETNIKIVFAAIYGAAALGVILYYAFFVSKGGGLQVVPIEIRAQNGSVVSGNAYLAITQTEQMVGLMNVTSMGSCNGEGSCIGMLFEFGQDSDVCFWMKNTIIPLKQSWIEANGTVSYIYNASPQSLKSVCYYGVAVLETPINSTIKQGDVVSYKLPG